jgi:xanthine dehydrogenase accessory factor
MSNQLISLLQQWKRDENKTQWVLGTVYKTERSAYRKAGAMMLINGLGQQFGLLSGGCLEADIIRNARKVIVTGKASSIVYDASDEDDLSYQMGLGCGGKVYIMLQALTEDNDLGLGDMLSALEDRECGTYHQKIGENEAFFDRNERQFLSKGLVRDGWLISSVEPVPHLLIIGGGMDARPVVSIAKEMGWEVTVSDTRPANARVEHFSRADMILRENGEALTQYIEKRKVDCVVLMSHSISIDAKGMLAIQNTNIRHAALLGPIHRFDQVLEAAGLTRYELTCSVSGPAGLDIGGQLPESIALSILAECHAVLHSKQATMKHRLAAE